MQRVVETSEMAALAARWRAEGRRVGFVPTMGYLHRGHTSLMARARPHVDVLVVSIYVNPLQFGPHEDLARYPRDLPGDLRACEEAGADVVFTPESLYPPGFQTTVSVSALATRWEGAARPGHFDGVATVVARLFGIVQPSLAVFGEKDFQQLAVLRAMVRDLSLPVEIVAGPLVRDEDGVALSSRNAYLSPPERVRARTLSRALAAMVRGPASVAARVEAGRALLDCDALDYLAIVDDDTLEPLVTVDRPARAIAVARYGIVRLLDNRAVVP